MRNVCFCVFLIFFHERVFGNMGTKNNKRNKSKVNFATASSVGRWKSAHFKKVKSKKMREKVKVIQNDW